MREKFGFIRLPVLLVVFFFIGRLALGAAGASYGIGNRLFSMGILQVHLALLWPAVGRRYRGYGIGGWILFVVMVGFVSWGGVRFFGACSFSVGLPPPCYCPSR